MPVHLRNFYYNKLLDAKKKENEKVSNSGAPNVAKPPSKVRVNK